MLKKNYKNIVISFAVILISLILSIYLIYEKNKEIKYNYNSLVQQSNEKISLVDAKFIYYGLPSENLIYKNKNGDYIYDKNMDVAMEIKGVKYAFSHMDCRNVLFENQRLGKPSHFYESKDKSNAILLVSKYQNIYLQGNDSSNYCLLKRMY